MREAAGAQVEDARVKGASLGNANMDDVAVRDTCFARNKNSYAERTAAGKMEG